MRMRLSCEKAGSGAVLRNDPDITARRWRWVQLVDAPRAGDDDEGARKDGTPRL